MKKTFISLSIAALFSSSMAEGCVNAGNTNPSCIRPGIDSAYVAPGAAALSGPGSLTPAFSTTSNNFTMVGAANGLTGGTNDVTFTWDGTYARQVVTDGTNNATLSSPTAFSGKKWTAHHVNVYGPGTYTFNAGCASGNPSCGTGPSYTMTVGTGQVGAHMLFNWSTSSDIDVILLWKMNDSWAGTGTVSAFQVGGGNTTATVWNAVSIDVGDGDRDASTNCSGSGCPISGAGMIDGPFLHQAANFNVNGVQAFDSTPPTVTGSSPADAAPAVSFSTTTYSVTYSEAMTAASINTGTPLTFSPAAAVGTPTSADNITWNFPVTLAGATTYTVTFNAGPTDLAGNALTLPANRTFTTTAVPDTTSPTISGRSPASAATLVAASAPIIVTFSEAMGGSAANAITLSQGATVIPCTFVGTVGNTVFTCVPASPLASNTVYTVAVAGNASRTAVDPVAAKDAAGNNLITAGGNTWSFTTAPVATLTSGGATVTITGGTGSMTSLSLVPSSQFGGNPPDRVSMDSGLNYSINGVAGSVTVTLTFPTSIVGKTGYKIVSGVYTPIPESAFTRLSDFSISMVLADGGAYDSDGVAGTVTDPIAFGLYVPPTPLGVSGGGGGCTVDSSGKDVSMLAALLASLGYAGWRRRRS